MLVFFIANIGRFSNKHNEGHRFCTALKISNWHHQRWSLKSDQKWSLPGEDGRSVKVKCFPKGYQSAHQTYGKVIIPHWCIFTNLHTEGIRTGVLVSDLSDHLPDFICSKEHIRTTQTKTTHLVQHIAKNNLTTFYDKVAETCSYTVFSIDDANSAYDEFYKILTPIYDVSSPYTPTRKTKKARKPSITAEF